MPLTGLKSASEQNQAVAWSEQILTLSMERVSSLGSQSLL